MSNKLFPINRMNKFLSEEDYNLELGIIREYLGDLNFTVVLYRVDRTKSNVDELYGEAYLDELRFKPPVELQVWVALKEPEVKEYDGGMSYKDVGNLDFYVLIDDLKTKDIDILYGDFIGYTLDEKTFKYWTVADDDRIFQSNKKALKGLKPFYRAISCVAVDVDEFFDNNAYL